jgi:hypothetical protein
MLAEVKLFERYDKAPILAALMVPVVAELIAVIADWPVVSELERPEAFPVKAPVKVVAPTEVRPDNDPPVILTLFEA